MPRGIAAKRHAQAVFQLALQQGQLEKWLEDLEIIATTLRQPEVMAILESPKVHLDEKMQLIRRCLPGVSQLALNLVYLLVARRRLRLTDQIVSEYKQLADAYQGLEHAEVTTAIPLDAEDEKRLSERLAALTGTRIMLTTKVDRDLIGGFVVRIGDHLIDGSTKSKLDSLRRRLIEAR
jgi:F-type H+-transporting ATPase subunit delta